jgi:hypothetical protein
MGDNSNRRTTLGPLNLSSLNSKQGILLSNPFDGKPPRMSLNPRKSSIGIVTTSRLTNCNKFFILLNNQILFYIENLA